MVREIVLIAHADPYYQTPGGIWTYLQNYCKFLANLKIKINLLGISHNKKGVLKIKVNKFKKILTCKKSNSYLFLINLLLKKPFIKINKNSVIHSQRVDCMLPFIFNKNRKIVTSHGNQTNSIKHRKNKLVYLVHKFIEGRVLRRIDKLIVVDSIAEKYFLDNYPFLKNKIEKIPVGINLKLFKPKNKKLMKKQLGYNNEDKILLYIGRFDVEKRIDLIVEVFNNLNRKVNNLNLILVGSGSMKKEILDLIKKFKLTNVKVMENVQHSKIPNILNCSDALILISNFEGFPTVILEALSCGVPCISTNVGDISKVVINGKTGYLVDEKNIVDQTIKLLNNSSKFKNHCLLVSKDYSWEKIGDRIFKSYKN